MSTLVVLLPQRQRLTARSVGGEPEGSSRSTEFEFVVSPDGLAIASSGRCVAALLPKANTVLAVTADADTSWHRIVLPKAPAGRLKAALIGVLEDALLEDADDVHLAVLRRQHDDGHLRAAAQLAAHLRAGQPGQHEVE